MKKCIGIVSAAIFLPKKGNLILLSNNGSLYLSEKNNTYYFASEKFALTSMGLQETEQIIGYKIFDFVESKSIKVDDIITQKRNLIPNLNLSSPQEKLLEFDPPELKRCTKCVLPETMPFINFDDKGECNYCKNYKKRNQPKPFSELLELVRPYRRKSNLSEVIVPFSGGRDSCFSLHLIVKELGLKNPTALTYSIDLSKQGI